jgi:2-amino-1-hydroxyethylphosphonate dioxygenase (glycine-forming)
MTPREIATQVLDLYARFGSRDYIGEPVSQLDHMSQTAQLAMHDGYDDEVVLAAFFHDVGHLCVAHTQENNMQGLGIKHHEHVGATYLRSLGFPEKIAQLVESHVTAKRYLCFVQPDYFNQLSPASQQTLMQQGGVMTTEEAIAFEKHPMAKLMVKMRQWDDAAKEANHPLIDITIIKNKIEAVLARVFAGA